MPARLFIIAFAALATAFLAAGAFGGSSAALEHVRLAAYLEAPLAPGKTSWVAIRQEMDPGWHTYWRNPGESGLPTSVSWSLPAGVRAGEIRWPTPEQFSDGTVINYGYAKEATLLVPLTASASAKPGAARLTVNLLACEHMCIPEQAVLDIDLRKASGSGSVFDAARHALPVPFAGASSFRLGAHRLRIAFDAPWLDGVTAGAVTVFPAAPDMVADGGVPQVEKNGDRIIWSVQAQDGVKRPQTLEGVLRIAGRGAFAYAARPAPAADSRAVGDAMGLWTAIALAFLGG